jgi:sugar-specific transcriptional regulator TrmB
VKSEVQPLLESIGLTKQEAKCFIALCELKESKVGALSRKAEIATANIYPVLDALMSMGLASYKTINNVRIFMPAPPEAINELVRKRQEELDQKKQEVQDAIAKLKRIPDFQENFSNYKFFVGVAGIKSMWNEVLEHMQTAKPSTLMLYGATKDAITNLRGFYDEFQRERARLGHKYQLLITPESRELASARKRQNSEVRFTQMSNEGEFAVFEDLFIVYYSVGPQPVGFLIRDRKIADAFKEIYIKVWDTAQK